MTDFVPNSTSQTPTATPDQAAAPVTTDPVTATPQAGQAAQTKMIGKYKVEVINDKCIGAASCVAIAANVFRLTEANIAEVISQDGDSDEMKLLAAQSCPTAAIVVTDMETGQKVWPLD